MHTHSPGAMPETVATAPLIPRGPSVNGLDFSLTATGVCVIRDGVVSTETFTSVGHKGDSLLKRGKRLNDLADQILLTTLFADLVVVESPAYGQTSGSHHDRSGLWWLVVHELLATCDVVELTPQTLKTYATGKGNSSKDAVLAAVVRRYADVEVRNNNEADAMVLGAIGARLLGRPIDDLPQTHLRAMEKVQVNR